MKKFFLSIFCFAGVALFAQNTPSTTANYDLAARFAPSRINRMVFSTTVNPNWLKHSNRFWYEYSTPAGKRFCILDAATGAKRDLFDPARIAAEVTMVVKDPFDAQHLPVQDLKFIDNETKIRFGIRSTLDAEKKEEDGDSQEERGNRRGRGGRGGGTGSATAEKKIFWFEYDLRTGVLTHLEDFDPEKRFPRWASISPDGETIVFSKH